ncbi:MAG: hypothetical protein A3F72_21315 [Bacteroidetes bacterium RIFCSPLOWO2_12_FULL_35_15]|nr:MAG: hypothetical protein A3F72_21315 [Bacteroidetes bacterium RIFCSPLOWO2_12_FULL_35_15]
MENKTYNSKLRALLSIRNLDKILNTHLEQMMEIEKQLDALNKNALTVLESHCSTESQEIWKTILKENSSTITSINQILRSAKEKVVSKDRSESTELWKKYELHLDKLKETYKTLENLGLEILPSKEHKHWEKDICTFDETILPLIVSHAEVCKQELELIARYTPKELDNITLIIMQHIPEDFTFEDADKYEKDYLKAFEEFKKEFRKEKNLWDKFLDVLAGGTHQPPSERVMLERWIEGEKQNL